MGAGTLQERAAGENVSYLTERALVQDLSAMVQSRNGPVRCRGITCEFDYAAGRTDLVGLGLKRLVHAFETKLSKWRDALEQARRNTCFAHYTYVALPAKTADPALKARDEFRRHGVGLLIVSGRQARLAIRPRRNVPLLPWLTEAAIARLVGK